MENATLPLAATTAVVIAATPAGVCADPGRTELAGYTDMVVPAGHLSAQLDREGGRHVSSPLLKRQRRGVARADDRLRRADATGPADSPTAALQMRGTGRLLLLRLGVANLSMAFVARYASRIIPRLVATDDGQPSASATVPAT